MSNSSDPLVSIIIPTYNHAVYLARALRSVLDQTYENWEAIIVDNHSNDDTDAVVKRFSDPRIGYLKIHNDGIIAASRNLGVTAARGSWIAFLDSDDWWTADKLATCSNYFNGDFDFIHHDLNLVYERPQFCRRGVTASRQLKSPILHDLLVNGNAIVNSTVIVRKKFITDIGGISEDKDMIAAEDYNTWLKIAALTERFKYLPESLGCYKVHAGGVSQRDMSKPAQVAIAQFKHVLTSEQITESDKLLSYIRGRFYYTKREHKLARLALKEALFSKNLNLNIKALLMLTLIFFRNNP